jgi:uncharacterized protein (DUF1697 family)
MAARTSYVALLRGINLGARNKLAMGDLRALVEGVGSQDVQTYVQSGNVVFESSAAAAKLERELAQAIRHAHGLDVPVLVRSSAQLDTIVKRNPFVKAGADEKSLHVTFLAGKPKRELVKALDPSASPPDELRVAGREVYLLCPKGYGRSKLSNAFFEKRLGEVATTRNWRTVTTLAELARD